MFLVSFNWSVTVHMLTRQVSDIPFWLIQIENAEWFLHTTFVKEIQRE